MFWTIVAWVLSVLLAWIMGGINVASAVIKYPERVGLEKIKEREVE